MRGIGRVYQRGYTWWIGYSHRGHEYRESSGSDNEAQAKRLLKKRLGEIGRGRFIGPVEEKVTFDAMAQDIKRDYETNGKRSLKSVILSTTHLKGFFGLDRALDITTDRIRAYISNRQGEGASNASINRELSALKRMFSLAIQAGKLSSRPYIPTLEENNARQGFLGHGEFLALRKNLPDHLHDPVTFLYHSGWRVSEMRALEWRDVDLAGNVVRLRPEISKNKDGRLLPLSGELLEIIRRANKQRQPELPSVFHSIGQPIGSFRKAWKTACCNAGLGRTEVQEDGSKKYFGTIVHDLRRTAVRNMVRAGIPERVAMSLTGHKTRNIFDRYNIVSEADLAHAAKRLQSHLDKQSKQPTVVKMTQVRGKKAV